MEVEAFPGFSTTQPISVIQGVICDVIYIWVEVVGRKSNLWTKNTMSEIFAGVSEDL